MRTRARVAGAAAVAAAAAVGVVLVATSGGGDPARDLGVRLDLREARALRVTLSGPLWTDRTVRDEEGTPDIAYVTEDEALTIAVRGRDGIRVNGITYRVDRQPAVRVRRCAGASCPRSVAVTVVPAVHRLGAGTHRIVIDVGSARPRHVASAAIEVTIGGPLPAIREAEPAVAVSPPAPSAPGSTAVGRQAQAIVAREQQAGVLRGVLGAAAPRFVQVGELQLGGRRLGASVLLSLPAARRNIGATVPGYVPTASGYRLQPVAFKAVALRDLLVDIDLQRGRVIAVEPGPGSQTSRWSPQQAATPTGAQDED